MAKATVGRFRSLLPDLDLTEISCSSLRRRFQSLLSSSPDEVILSMDITVLSNEERLERVNLRLSTREFSQIVLRNFALPS